MAVHLGRRTVCSSTSEQGKEISIVGAWITLIIEVALVAMVLWIPGGCTLSKVVLAIMNIVFNMN